MLFEIFHGFADARMMIKNPSRNNGEEFRNAEAGELSGQIFFRSTSVFFIVTDSIGKAKQGQI